MSKLTTDLRKLPVPIEIIEKNSEWYVMAKIQFNHRTNQYNRITIARENGDFNAMCRTAIKNFKAGIDADGKEFTL